MRIRALAVVVAVVVAVLGCAWIGSAADAIMTPLIVDPAIAISSSLANDEMKGVHDNAAQIEAQAAKLTPPASKLAAAAKTLHGASKIDAARTAFGKMNEELLAYMKAHKLTVDPSTKVAICPMVNKPWLQKAASIQNPYYGAEMLTCGSFTK